MTHTDYLGREIKPGDRVVYPVRLSSRMWLTHGTVVEVTKVNEWGEKTRGSVPAVRIEIETETDVPIYPKDSDGKPMHHRMVDGKKEQIEPKWGKKITKRIITSTHLDRMVVVPVEGS